MGRVSDAITMLAGSSAILFALSCSSPQSAYEDAGELNTVDAFQRFLEKHGDSPYAARARAQIEALEYAKVQRVSTVEAYDAYLAQYPRGANASRAQDAIGLIHYQQATAAGTLDAFQRYLDVHPKGARSRQALEAMDSIRFSEAESEQTVDAYTRYVSGPPPLAHADRARSAIEGLLYTDAVRIGTEASLSGFLVDHPDGLNATDIVRRLEPFRYRETMAAANADAYRAFLAEYPMSEHSSEMRAALAKLEDEQYGDLTKNIDVSSPGPWGDTPLHKSVLEGNVTMTRALLWKSADVNSRIPRTGITPLHIAALKGNLEMALILTEHGARPCDTDRVGNLPIDLSSKESPVERLLTKEGCHRSEATYVPLPDPSVVDDGSRVLSKNLMVMVDGNTRQHFGLHWERPSIVSSSQTLWFDFYDGAWKSGSGPDDPYAP